MATNNTQVSYSDYVRKFWKLFGYTFGGVLLFFLLASWGFFGKMPSFDELENPDTNIATEIISSDGVTLGKFYKENRTPVKYEDLPKHLVEALVSTEDERFYEHGGVDYWGVLRATLANLRGGLSQGASTITMQVARNFFLTNEKSFIDIRNYWIEETLKYNKGGNFYFIENAKLETKLNLGLFDGASGVGLALLSIISESNYNWTKILLLK